MIDRHFVVIRVTVEESKEKQALNTPGGGALQKELGGPAGLPYFAFLDSDGKPIVNSLRPEPGKPRGANIGHPVKPHEIDWFLEMVRKAAPRATPEELATLEKWLRAQKK